MYKDEEFGEVWSKFCINAADKNSDNPFPTLITQKQVAQVFFIHGANRALRFVEEAIEDLKKG
jgi:hypothetical protein